MNTYARGPDSSYRRGKRRPAVGVRARQLPTAGGLPAVVGSSRRRSISMRDILFSMRERMLRPDCEGKRSRVPALVGIWCVLFVLGRVSAAATTYGVDRLTDANPAGGGQGAGLDGDLRYALTQAQSGDAISIHVAGTIDLTAALPVLTRNICIQGLGADLLTVHGAGGSVFAVHERDDRHALGPGHYRRRRSRRRDLQSGHAHAEQRHRPWQHGRRSHERRWHRRRHLERRRCHPDAERLDHQRQLGDREPVLCAEPRRRHCQLRNPDAQQLHGQRQLRQPGVRRRDLQCSRCEHFDFERLHRQREFCDGSIPAVASTTAAR